MTVNLDRRTRSDAQCRTQICGAFFKEEFPRLADAHGELVASGMNKLGAPPLAVTVGDDIWTILPVGETVEAVRDEVSGAAIVTFTPEQFSGWAQNLVSLSGLAIAGQLQLAGGSSADISSWDALWLTLLEGWSVLDDEIAFLDRDGSPLDLSRSFGPEDDPDEIAHFLREAGFLHLTGWLPVSSMSAIIADMDSALPHYRDGDGKSWWAVLADGTQRCVRLQKFVEHSEATSDLLKSDVWTRLAQVVSGSEEFLPPPADGSNLEALFKPVGVVSGASDLPFHRDCYLGRHAYDCTKLTIGVALTPSSKANGLLKVAAGSHRVAMPVHTAQVAPYLPIVELPTEPGDLTVHLSCTLHAATPPVEAERRVIYLGMDLASKGEAKAPSETETAKIRSRVNDLIQ